MSEPTGATATMQRGSAQGTGSQSRGHSMGREVGAVLVGLVALFLAIALVTSATGDNSTGIVGLRAAQVLEFLFGQVLAYAVPLALLVVAVILWNGKQVRRMPERILGAVILVFAVGAMIAIPHSNSDLTGDPAFFHAGAVGHGLVHSKTLNLLGALGLAGCILVLSCAALLGILLIAWRSPRAAVSDVFRFLEWVGMITGMIRPVNEAKQGTPAPTTGSLWAETSGIKVSPAAVRTTRTVLRPSPPTIQPPGSPNRAAFRTLVPGTPKPSETEPQIAPPPPSVNDAESVSDLFPKFTSDSRITNRPEFVPPTQRPASAPVAHAQIPSSKPISPVDSAPLAVWVEESAPESVPDSAAPSPEVSCEDISPARRPWPGFPHRAPSAQREPGSESCMWISKAPAFRAGGSVQQEAKADRAHLQTNPGCSEPPTIQLTRDKNEKPPVDSDFAPNNTVNPSRPAPLDSQWTAESRATQAPEVAVRQSNWDRITNKPNTTGSDPAPFDSRFSPQTLEPNTGEDSSAASSSASQQLNQATSELPPSDEPVRTDSVLSSAPKVNPVADTSRELWRGEYVDRSPADSSNEADASDFGPSSDGATPEFVPAAWRESMDPAPGIWPGGRSQAEFVMREEFRLPTLDLFDVPPPCQARLPQEELLEMADRLQTCLSNHNIDATVENAVQGPAVIRFDMRPAEAQRVAPIARLDREIAIAMRCDRVRILGPGAAGTIGVEIPSPKRETVFLVDLLKAPVFRTHPAPLAVPLGRGMSGEPVLCDLAATPHLLIAGSTGQGKSVCLNSILISLLMRRSPDELRLLLIDPKQVELNFFRAIPHLLAPIITEPRKAAAALQWVCEVMEHRYDLCKQLNTRNIDSYNAIARGGAGHPKAGGRDLEIMPHIIVVIDELADLMLQVRREIEEPFSRLAAKARACGIHLIVATQRPSVDVITGTIKNNFPSRIAFLTKTEADSRTVLGQSGAETLLGKGDMIYDLAGARELQRVQGCFVSEADVERVTDFLRAQGTVRYVKHDFPLAGEENRNGRVRTVSVEEYTPGSGSGEDEMERIYERALRLVLENRKASVSMVQRKLQIGFPKAGRLMDMMEERGIVGPADSSKVREILVDPDEYLRRMDEKDRDGIYYDE